MMNKKIIYGLFRKKITVLGLPMFLFLNIKKF